MSLEDCTTKTSQIHFKLRAELWNQSKFSLETGKFRGGTTILIKDNLVPLIEEHAILVSNRVQFTTFQFSPINKIRIMNVYGYNQIVARIKLWETIAQANLPQAD